MSEKNIQLFVYAELEKQNKEFLRNGLPAGIKVVFLDEISEDALEEAFAASTYVYGNPPAEWFEKKDARIEWVQLYSTGFNEYQRLKRAVPVSNLHGFFARPCAETVIAGILTLYRKTDELTLLKDRKEWKGVALRPQLQLLHGKHVIMLGTGTIAMAIRTLLTGFQCKVEFYGRSHPEARLRSRPQLLEALPGAQILIDTLPGTAQTHEFISAAVLNAMHPTAIFVNIGRGSTVDEPALIKALQEQRISGAVLDVNAAEPLPGDSPLWDLPNVILTQHTGGGFADEQKSKITFFLENLQRVLKGEEPLNLVDLPKGY